MDDEGGCPSGLKFPDSAIAHANVHIAGSDIMMSDSVASDGLHYAGFTLVLDTQDVKEGKRWFDNLAANGKVEMRWQGDLLGRTDSVASSTDMACRG
ncbi:Uncharacterised protein [Kluyvera cryocrescens]|uniref:Uncharacterized protein n=1 Tax=Kluyvera cryocrescens TaxID=580 RepID=A0A485A754_KLUCR|nr:Uncharacterised protein [Kluyvera cryocrescens]